MMLQVTRLNLPEGQPSAENPCQLSSKGVLFANQFRFTLKAPITTAADNNLE